MRGFRQLAGVPAGDGAECGECDADLGVPLASLALLRPRRRSSVWSAVSELGQAGRQAGRTVLLLLLLLALEGGGGTSRAAALGFMGYVVRTGEPPQKAPQARLAVVFFESFHTFRCLERNKEGFYRAEAPITGETKAKWFHIWLI